MFGFDALNHYAAIMSDDTAAVTQFAEYLDQIEQLANTIKEALERVSYGGRLLSGSRFTVKPLVDFGNSGRVNELPKVEYLVTKQVGSHKGAYTITEAELDALVNPEDFGDLVGRVLKVLNKRISEQNKGQGGWYEAGGNAKSVDSVRLYESPADQLMMDSVREQAKKQRIQAEIEEHQAIESIKQAAQEQ